MYSNDKTTQILVGLLKAHNIHRIIASPGTTNMCFVGSVQNDPWFQVYSVVDERSAAYMACGMSTESGEPVVITCTEATASRNYFPGLTEAFYRKLPILVITGFHNLDSIGHLQSQCIDRSLQPADTVRLSVNTRVSKNEQDEWYNTVNINKAILALSHNGGGPAHINLQFPKNRCFDCKELPKVRKISRIMIDGNFPEMPRGRIAISVGSHKPWSSDLTEAVNSFCESNNAVVFCDHTSGYKGKYRVDYSIVSGQRNYKSFIEKADLLIHIGEVSGDVYTQEKLKASKMTWRVSEDGEVRDFFRNLSYVFQMSEVSFFRKYNAEKITNTYLNECKSEIEKVRNSIPDLPFSNMWIAQTLATFLPNNSTFHMGIFNSLRSWNMTEVDTTILSECNVGGFGIDGALSTIVGAALANPNRLFFCMCGDLAFFYDMNVLGNRHMVKNLRILLVNNAKGTEFRNYGHPAYQLGEEADPFMAAAGHFGNKSTTLVKSYVESLGFKYLFANDKESFVNMVSSFVDTSVEGPVLLEVFTNSRDESKAVELLRNSINDNSIKSVIKKIVGEEQITKVKKIIRK